MENKEQVWLSKQEALAYYGMGLTAFHEWARKGKITRREAPTGKRMGYEYLQDEELMKAIQVLKAIDNRWN